MPATSLIGPELQGFNSFLDNTLVTPANLSDKTSFRELLAQVREEVLGVYANQDMPL